MKNVKTKEMLAIDAMERKRAENLGKKTEFEVRGRAISSRKLERWRKNRAGSKIAVGESSGNTEVIPGIAESMCSLLCVLVWADLLTK
jgi:hypothetical protein